MSTMATVCENATASLPGLSNLSIDDVGTEFSFLEEVENEKYAKSTLQPVDFEDGNGKVLRLREGDGMLFSRNVVPDILDRFYTMQGREDDVIVATYPKSGTHWMWEIVSQLKKGSGALLTETMQHVDFFPMNMLEAMPSPRVLATHMPFSRMARDFQSYNCKIIWVVRNPWDVAVSYYNFIKKINIFEYSGDWTGFFDLFLDGNVPYNSWFEHTLDWLKAMETNPNILMVRYEDLHQNFKKEVRRVAHFLNSQVSEDVLQAIQRETTFANMSEKKFDMSLCLSKDGSSPVYRKGKCGDWCNWFTDQQAAELKGAYRVTLGTYQRYLKYNNDSSILGMQQTSS